MQRIVAGLRAAFLTVMLCASARAAAVAIPVFANGQGISCRQCHTSFPGMSAYGMMTMMSNFQNLDWRKQHQAFPLSLRMQIYSFLGNKDRPAQTYANTLSILGGGFIGRNFTWYAEQPIVDSGFPGTTEQMWLSWNGLLGGTNSLQVGKFHTPFPFMPAHGWTIASYLLATQDNAQNTFEPSGSRWGAAFNGMSNEFMYNLSYLTGEYPISKALDYNRADGPRTLDFNLSYGGMTVPYSVGIVAMHGVTPLRNSAGTYVADDPFSREGLYYSYQTAKYLIQTMYYHGYDVQPDVGVPGTTFNGGMLEVQRDFGWRNHVLLRYDIASSDTLNRQIVLDVAHHLQPNLKLTGEVALSPHARPSIGFSFDWAGPFIAGERYLWNAPVGARVASALSAPAPSTEPSSAPTTSAPTVGTQALNAANEGAKLVQQSGCIGCHGANFQGGLGPKLYGIEHVLSTAQIANAIKHPKPPMPDFGFTDTQISSIVAYLSNLDGGTGSNAPVVTFGPSPPTAGTIAVTVRFPAPPKQATIVPQMQMGRGQMHSATATLTATSDPRVWTGTIDFSMAGPWTIVLQYDGARMEIPVQVSSP